jgi:hypothetical protein
MDVIWWWRGLEVYRRRPRWIQASVHAFFAFMFFNATVVFAAGPVRWLGLAATAALGFVWWRSACGAAAYLVRDAEIGAARPSDKCWTTRQD